MRCRRRDTPPWYDRTISGEATHDAISYGAEKEALGRRLARIEGQVRGLRAMIDDEAYCIDVITQVAAAQRALEGVALKLLESHTDHCVRGAVAAGGPEADEKVDELLETVRRFSRVR